MDGVREIRKFESDEDVWDVIDICIQETLDYNETEGKSFDVAQSVATKVPFFTCSNFVINEELLKDIQRYVYCEEFSIAPYPGSYGEQPYRWTQKAFLFKKAFNKRTQHKGSKK